MVFLLHYGSDLVDQLLRLITGSLTNVTGFSLQLAGDLVNAPFDFNAVIAHELARSFLDFAFGLFETAFYLILVHDVTLLSIEKMKRQKSAFTTSM
jgi:hypothetical protein